MRILFFITALLLLSGCDTGFRQMGTTEYGVLFRKLPPSLGGGVGMKVINPGEYALIWPWDRIYRFDISLQYISWGAGSNKEGYKQHSDYVYTRAVDGNEVALAVTVQYRVSDKPEDLVRLVHNVANSNMAVDTLVETVARANIRAFMNELKTSAFFDGKARYEAIDKSKDAMNTNLNPEGIYIEKVILDEHRFERQLRDGSTDRSYQDKIDETQKIGQDTERELLRIDTIRAQKAQEFNEVQGKVNRQIAEADGYSKQSKLRGDGFLQAKTNDALGVLAKGKSEVDGMKQKIAALEGQGGIELLKLEFAKYLSKEKPSFVTLGDQSNSNNVDVRKLDTNELLRQIGMSEALKEEKKVQPANQ
ncbi:MAG: SPFH domain-containing protein [bacterium]|nr:SPFH domain-containing protein [bacterium]